MPHGRRVNRVGITHKHMYCTDNAHRDQCDMIAAAGSYVDPDGKVLIYATEHADDNPLFFDPNDKAPPRFPPGISKVHGNSDPWWQNNQASGSILRAVEFHERRGSDSESPFESCPTLDKAWVEFYTDSNFNEWGRSAATYYRIDYNERDAKNSFDLTTNNYSDKASSIRFCIPPGHSFRFFKDVNRRGSSQGLTGTGTNHFIRNLEGMQYSSGGLNVNDSITSYSFEEGRTGSRGWQGTAETE